MRRLTALLAATAVSACSLAPTYERPATPVPPSWPVGDAYLRQSEAPLPTVTYRDIFRDARLQQLIEQAFANNRDLRIAAANIATARGQYRVQRSELFPTISTSARASFSNGGSTGTSGSGTGSGTGTGTGTGTGVGTTANSSGGVNGFYQVDVGTSAWEIDLFGRIRSLSRAALDEYFATEAAARATRLTLVANIADAWLIYAADQALFKIAQDTVRSAESSVRLTRLRLEGGVAPRTDLRQAELIQAQAQADLATSRTALAQDVNLLQLLVGAPIDPALLPLTLDQAGATLGELPAGLDSGILLRRPDVVQAEYSLRAANARIGAARAAFFPRISLTGLVGFASSALGSLFSGDGFNWSVAPGVSTNIFDFGAARGDLLATRGQRDAALASYERTIQTAFREVSDALARRGTISDELAAQQRLVAASLDNYRLSDLRYRGGIDTFLQSLDAQRSLYNAQRSLVATQLGRAQNLVDLYRTLGGDALLEAADTGPRPLAPEPTATPVPRSR
jgi:multidrug efflux system outer membrane protein